MKIGVFNSGIYWQEFGFRKSGYSFDVLYIYKVDWDIHEYDIIIIPKGIHQEFLKAYSKKLLEWIRFGGILITFGEVDGNWIKDTHWEPSIKGQSVKIVDTNHHVLNNISEDDINMWSKAVHGYFAKTPNNSTTILSDNKKNVIAFIDSNIGKGKLLAMTLDPDYHAYTEIEFAKVMLTNIIEWAHNEAKNSRKSLNNSELNRPFLMQFNSYLKENIFTKTKILLILIGIIAGIIVKLIMNSIK